VTVTSRRAHLTAGENARLDAVASYGIVGTAPEPDLVLIAQMAADLCGVPQAVVNIIGSDRQYQVATHGISAGVCAREDSMCAVTITEPAAVVVADASADPRFRSNPFVTGEIDSVRFYASTHLRTPAGRVIGTLCVFDSEPRTIDDAQRTSLDRLARMAVNVMEVRRYSRVLAEALTERDRTLMVLRQAHTELERSNRALSQVAGKISHDLRNPLTGVIGFLDMATETAGVTADEDAKVMLGRAMAASNRMQALIEEVLDRAAS